ncbi:MAG: aconitate hydratase, partial [Planctomycetia bacterium]|nr:aconitate hydratase [Planctomycetia bacterium]
AADEDYDAIDAGDELELGGVLKADASGDPLTITNRSKQRTFTARLALGDRARKILLAGGVLNWMKQKQRGE